MNDLLHAAKFSKFCSEESIYLENFFIILLYLTCSSERGKKFYFSIVLHPSKTRNSLLAKAIKKEFFQVKSTDEMFCFENRSSVYYIRESACMRGG